MRHLRAAIILAITLAAGAARATPPVVCGAGKYNEPNGSPTYDTAGNWSIVWQDRSNPPAFLHATMYLTTCNSFITGYMGLPVEITDPYQAAAWDWKIQGSQNGASVMLRTSSGGNTPWYFELLQNTNHARDTGLMQGETYAGVGHTDRGVLFYATYQTGQGSRQIVVGQQTPCPSSIVPAQSVAGTFRYAWGSGWTGVFTLHQDGPWLYGNIGVPDQIGAGDLHDHWNWPFFGLITSDNTIQIPSEPGYGFGDPWWFRMPLTAFSPVTFSGPDFAYACHIPAGTMTIVKQ